MLHSYRSTVNLIDDENCEGTNTISDSIAESKHTSIYLDSEEFDVSFENGMLSKYSSGTFNFNEWLSIKPSIRHY